MSHPDIDQCLVAQQVQRRELPQITNPAEQALFIGKASNSGTQRGGTPWERWGWPDLHGLVWNHATCPDYT
jgi:hypothetical protein